jgi:AAA+ ATPase superfamily predicted ATPase
MPTANSSIDYTKIYTDSPPQHPNLILGSLQILFWLFFHPSAWRNHIKSIDPLLDRNNSLIIVFRQIRWQNPAIWKLLLQGHIILPIIAYLILGLILFLFGVPISIILTRVAVGVAVGVAFGVAFSVAFGVVGGVAFGVAGVVAFGVGYGVGYGVAEGVAVGVAGGVAIGVAYSVAYSVAVGVAYSVAVGVEFGVAVGVAIGVMGGVARGVAGGMAGGVGLTINSWRPIIFLPLLTLWNFLLYRLDKMRNARSPCLLRFHSAFWDEWQKLNLLGLDNYLLFIIERNSVEGKAALEYLSTSKQRWAAQAVQIELDRRNLESCVNLAAIREVHKSLEISELRNPVSSILHIFNRISEAVDGALNQKSSYNQRLALRNIVDKLNGNLRDFTRSNEKYTVRFRPIAKKWLEITNNHIEELTRLVEQNQEIDNPYIVGVPLTLEQEIFTGRNDIGAYIEKLLLDRRRPPLLLYGQRRMGKTSLLHNIGKLLPNNIIPMFVDLQGTASSASDHIGFLYNLAKGMIISAKNQSAVKLPPLTRENLTDDPFTRFNDWLDEVETILEQNTALLMLDEFETLDAAINKGRFDEEDILGMLRHLIQHRHKFKLLLAGSHTIAEYQRWASYLINVQVVHISYLQESEARKLIESPTKEFPLVYQPESLKRILQITRCHPFLVQLICSEIIFLKNQQDPAMRRLVTLVDVEAAIPKALENGSFFFSDIQNNQIDDNGRNILKFMAIQGEGGVISQQTILQKFLNSESSLLLLLRRELIEENNQGYYFQIELIRYWFASDQNLN